MHLYFLSLVKGIKLMFDLIICIIIGLMIGLLIVTLHYKDKGKREFEERQERYRRMI